MTDIKLLVLKKKKKKESVLTKKKYGYSIEMTVTE